MTRSTFYVDNYGIVVYYGHAGLFVSAVRGARAQHVHEIKVLAVDVAKHSQLLAGIHLFHAHRLGTAMFILPHRISI